MVAESSTMSTFSGVIPAVSELLVCIFTSLLRLGSVFVFEFHDQLSAFDGHRGAAGPRAAHLLAIEQHAAAPQGAPRREQVALGHLLGPGLAGDGGGADE